MKHSASIQRLIFITLFLPLLCFANDATSTLPSPLSLQKALELLDTAHPDIELSTAKLKQAQAELLLSESKTDFRSYLDLAAAVARPSTENEISNDNYARLVITKTLYDFGQNDAENNSLNAFVQSEEIKSGQIYQHHQLEIMKRFFDVLLADLRYAVDDEEMTQRYLKYDKKRERFELGMVSNVEVQRAENHYREALIERATSDKNIQSSRLMLAIALNRPDELPDELVKPDLSYLSDDIPERETLYEEAMKMNPFIMAAQREVEAAQQQLMAQRTRNRPTISAQFELGEYEQERQSRDTARAQLLLRVPLYQSGETKASVDRASAQLLQKKARLKKLEQELLINIATILKELSILKTKKQTAAQRLNFRDLDLEYRRALYEMEAATNMSEKQAKLTEAQWHTAKLEYEHALLEAQLNILLGKPLIPTKGPQSP
jgi:outer membrane protein TolC